MCSKNPDMILRSQEEFIVFDWKSRTSFSNSFPCNSFSEYGKKYEQTALEIYDRSLKSNKEEMYCMCRGERIVPKVVKNGVCIQEEYVTKCNFSAFDSELHLCKEHELNIDKIISFPNFPEIIYECSVSNCTNSTRDDGTKCKKCGRHELIKKRQ